MPDANTVESAIKNLTGAEKFLGRREIKELPKILWEDELPEKIIQGLYNNGNGILVATNKRLIFIDKGMFSLKVEDFPYDKITSIQYSTGMMFGGMDIFCSGNKAEIKRVAKDQVKSFADYVRARITKASTHANMPEPTPAPQSTSNDDDFIAKLERLAKLKEQGILTEDEFLVQKMKILNS